MSAIASAILRVVVFPYEGKLVTLDQLSFTQKGCMETNDSTVPLVDQVKPASESLGAGMYSSLMCTFDILSPINYLGSTSVWRSIMTIVDRMDPWVLPSHYEPGVPLLVMKVAYQAVVNTTVDSIVTPSSVS